MSEKESEIAKTISESIKLIKLKNSYNWEIRILNHDIEQLAILDNKMKQKFLSESSKKDYSKDYSMTYEKEEMQ